MYEISLNQNEKRQVLGVLESREDLETFLEAMKNSLPFNGEEDSLYLDPAQLKDYQEFSFRGHILPLSRFAFASLDPIYLDILYLNNLSQKGEGYLEGTTVIENYAIPNEEVKSYIEERETAYSRVKTSLEKMGYHATRSLQGSEDGEAIVLENGPFGQWYFAALDPAFVEAVPKEDRDLEAFVRSFLAEED